MRLLQELASELPPRVTLRQLLAGHASIQITADRYGHLSADDLVDMVDEIAA